MTLVSLAGCHPAISFDLVYATADNLAGKPLYNSAAAYLHADALPVLKRAADMAAKLDLALVILDAYRPPPAQAALWQACPDARYVAPPEIGSDHSRGVAVDLTLARGGTALEMGTAFDDMSAASHHASLEITAEALHNRSVLCGLMGAAGFAPNRYEWWHYQLPDARRYPLIGDGDSVPAFAAVP